MSAEAIRIVPLRVPAQLVEIEIVASTPPKLTYRGGVLLSAVEVVTLFWGASWNDPANQSLVGSINSFFDYILTSRLLDDLAEYSVPGQAIGHGSRIGTTTVTSPAPASSVTDADIQQLLQNQIAAGGSVPQPTPNSLYFVYLPPGVTVTAGGGRSCLSFCGYHDTINGQVFYAAMPYPGCSGCTGNLATLDALTVVSSHELCEAITDPVPGQGWYDDTHGEIGDICAWQTGTLGSYTIQLEWSNAHNACNGITGSS